MKPAYAEWFTAFWIHWGSLVVSLWFKVAIAKLPTQLHGSMRAIKWGGGSATLAAASGNVRIKAFYSIHVSHPPTSGYSASSNKQTDSYTSTISKQWLEVNPKSNMTCWSSRAHLVTMVSLNQRWETAWFSQSRARLNERPWINNFAGEYSA